ncbi:anaerobic sulfatase maturase [Rhodoblastus sphagnicola]|uniref:Anaerobic sulfatase maturase n=1 Tax=Rhodoblastus sphagnicola TaxID=333368 RepID=A0A2S6N8A4_9HYPH|nr:anaerobic sulfatase maturase [Rhodoblastus sphagnicola]MBB4196744.1 uncharacterized protein [Rhodoblastus sphagnicola]PPQ30838.1 anaerobic sulfatase maturase [Rhodoblastus sphagnicola]
MSRRGAVQLMAKPTGAACNLACDYCFFRAKTDLYPGSSFRMSEEVLEAYIRQYLAQSGPEAVFLWQGGEPTLAGLDFYRRAVALQRRYRRPRQIVSNSLQTNGILLDDSWCAFLRQEGFLVGISLDGPADRHDLYRRDKAGHGTFDKVMRALARLRRHGVEFNILATVNAANAAHPLEVYRFLRDAAGGRFLQFIPVVERAESGEISARSVAPAAWGRFLIEIFDEWLRRDVGRVSVQIFEAALAARVGEPAPVCVFAETCGQALVLEHGGDVFMCDHFVDARHRLGNLLETPLADLAARAELARFGLDKRDALPTRCQSCDVLFACHGECPKNRFVKATEGGADVNYLCEGYRAFFRHVDAPMRRLAAALAPPPGEKIGVNAPCPCGSGQKFKRCHGASAPDRKRTAG